MKTIAWQMSVGVGKPPQKLRGAQRTQCVNIIAATGQRFLLSKPVSVACTKQPAARAAVERGVRLARRPRHRLISLARRPPATPTPHSAPPPVHRKHHRPPLGTRHRHRRRRPDGPPRIMHCTYAKFHNCNHGVVQKINNFRLLKKTRKHWRLRNYGGSPDTDENNAAQTNADPFKCPPNWARGASVEQKFNMQCDRLAT